jgi:hypothetical protein
VKKAMHNLAGAYITLIFFKKRMHMFNQRFQSIAIGGRRTCDIAELRNTDRFAAGSSRSG